MDQIACERRQPVMLALRPSVFDGDIAMVNVARVVQALPERDQWGLELGGGLTVEEPDHRQRRLLRTHRERPCRRRAAERSDEFAPGVWKRTRPTKLAPKAIACILAEDQRYWRD